ncbi:hypothetical protein LY474_07295 [Myxococcus stipitatus]|uniref:hypothetical protein n=1 Tax=Myxococcus stipitatus TaxID=83455 RepID=UPI001F20E415|nr:hypothetical protein [Myxococcus stipitatus]MCE9667618.1 hypothetical protein [Myxococcus stipitatus]
MSANFCIVGVAPRELAERLPVSPRYWSRIVRADVRERILERQLDCGLLDFLLDEVLPDLTPQELFALGLELVLVVPDEPFRTDLAEMGEFYLRGFDWDGPLPPGLDLRRTMLDRRTVLGLFEWYMSLSHVFDNGYNTLAFDSPLIERARAVKQAPRRQYEYFGFALGLLNEVWTGLLESPCEVFYWSVE